MIRSLFFSMFFAVLLAGGFFLFGTVSAAPNCLLISPEASEADKEICKKELAQIEAELTELLEKQKVQQKNSGTLQGDVAYLNSQIKALQTKVKARALAIAQLKIAIKEKEKTIGKLSEKIEKQYASIAQLLRNTNDFDNESFVHLILSDASLSDFYSDLESYASIKQAVKASVDELRGIKSLTETERQELEKKQNAEADAKADLESAQKKTTQSEAEKKQLLAISKNKEAEYKKLAAEKKAKADKIRSALFPLRDSAAIPFGTALTYAEDAQKKTGVRPAFVLAILQQESNLGANVGSCVITNLTTGETKGVNSGTIFPNGIHPTRDLPLLQGIVESVGRVPLTTRVSCPLASGGYGGAMGPAQFIPSTWNMMKSRVANALGKTVADPWNPQDAIMASSFLLMDNGAGAGGYTAERTAALRYYAGGNWNKPANAFYGDQVMGRVAKIQADIDLLYNQ
jgi:membrane-bound lytic murein transglycosylase B